MFRMNGMRRLFFSALTAIVLTATASFAETDDSYIQLTRISLIEGNVSCQRVPDEEWTAAGVNMPLEPGDRIYTGYGGRVEIEFEEGSVLRLAENTDVEILTLDENFVQIRMLLGTASITVEKGVDFEIATPAAAFSIEKTGIYRFEVAEDGRSEAIVRKGNLETVNHNFARVTKTGELIRVYPDATGPIVMAHSQRDAWDEWTDRRDANRRPSTAVRRYIPDNVYIGVKELDRHGHWVYVTNYGWGWIPYVASGWSPYSDGRWVYRPRFGWTWVSYETWGWLPYHYGRWYRDARYGWTWFPGASVAFRFWSPGLVVFYSGPGWISWGPLGPGDYYDVSYYRYRRAYAADLARVRVLAVRQPGNYINRNTRGAFQTVSIDHFRGVNSVGQNANARRMDIAQPWRQGNLVRGGLDVSPARESFRPAPDRRVERPRVETSRPVVVRNTPPQTSGNSGRFTQAGNPRVSPKPVPPAASKPAPSQGNRQSGQGANPGNSKPAPPAVKPAPPQENRQSGQGANPGNSRPAPPAVKPAPSQENRQSGQGANPGNSRPAPPAAKPAPPQENRQSGQETNPGNSRPAPPAAKPAPPQEGNSTGNGNRQTAAGQSSQSAPEASSARQNNSDSSTRNSSGENRDQSTTSRPAASQGNRQTERSNAGNSSSSLRENGRSSSVSNSSGSATRQTAPAQRTPRTGQQSGAPSARPARK